MSHGIAHEAGNVFQKNVLFPWTEKQAGRNLQTVGCIVDDRDS